MSISAGVRLGPYEIVSLLGAGGMGEVYRARETRRLGREVALKLLPPHLTLSPEARQRFEREAKAIAALSHPSICALYDVGREGEADYLVMELLEGELLASASGMGLSRSSRCCDTESRSPRRWAGRTSWGSCTGTSSRAT